MMGFGMGLGTLGVVILFFFLVVIIGLAIWLLGNLFPKSQNGPRGFGLGVQRESPLEILQRRYAAGEITKEDYAEMRE